MTSTIRDTAVMVNALTGCAQACRKLTDPSNGDVLFSYPPRFLQLLNDCAAACEIAVLLIERKSEIMDSFMEICEEYSLECAGECSNYTGDDFEECTKACDRVAKICLSFILGKEPL